MANVDIDKIHKEIVDGSLKNSRERRDDARRNLDFYRGNFKPYPTRDPGDNSDGNRYPRVSLFMQRAAVAGAALLYKKGPARKLPDHPEAGEWLNDVYRKGNVDALLQHADRLTFVCDAALIEVIPTENEKQPVRFRLWDAASFDVWPDDSDPTETGAVATIDVRDRRRRLTLWTAEEVRFYETKQWDENTKTAGATAYRFVGQIPNILGVLPFVPVRYDIPTTDWWVDGPGDFYQSTNDWINKRLTDVVDACRFNLNPVLWLSNVSEAFRPPSPLKPGSVINPPPALRTAGADPPAPDAKYLQADPGFVEAAWNDLNYGIDHALEMSGVDPKSVRITTDSAASGASLIAEEIAPIKAAEARQRKASAEEDRLARVTLAVGAAHLGRQEVGEYTVTAQHLAAAAEDPGLVLTWPELFPKVPGTESDQSDQWLLDNGLTSRTRLVMERFKMTEDEAEEYIAEIAEQLARERELLSAAMPTQDPQQQGQQQQEEDPQASEDSEDMTDEESDPEAD